MLFLLISVVPAAMVAVMPNIHHSLAMSHYLCPHIVWKVLHLYVLTP